MQNSWLKRMLGGVGMLVLLLPLSFSLSADQAVVEQNQAQLLLERYQRQQQHITKIQNNKEDLSSLEQAALDHRLFERHLSAFETLNQLSKHLIGQSQQDNKESSTMAEIDRIIKQNNQDLTNALKKLQRDFNSDYAQQEEYSTGALRLYIEHLTIQDTIYSAMTKQVLNQLALGFDTGQAKEYLLDQLYNRAEYFSGMVDLVAKKRQELNKLIGLIADNQALKDKLSVVTEQLAVAGESFNLTIDLLTQLGFDADFYRQTLLKLGGQITTDVLDVSILSGLAKRAINRTSNYLTEHAGEWIFTLLLLTVIYYIFRTLSRLTRKVLSKSLDSTSLNLSSLMRNMIISSASRLVMILGIFIALSQIGISLAPVLAGLGVVGFIIGFALQDTLSNFAAGMMILIYRPYDVGDMVEVAGGVLGKVKSMNLVSTTILTIDNQTLVIPNSKIWGDVIKNVTAQKLRRVDLIFGIGYADDITKTEAVLAEILLAHPQVLKQPEPMVKLHTLNESSVDFVVRPWVKTDDYWDVYWDLTRQVKMRFDQEGISIPFPQRDVHIYPAAPNADEKS